MSFPVANPDLQISGGGSHFFPALRASVWSNNNGGGRAAATLDPPLISYHRMSLTSLYEYGRFPFVRIDRPDLFRRNDNQFPFNQNQLNQSNPK